MDVASVTLEEVFKAAQIRAASLVPETSGYLTLAIADASARLPYRLEDDMVSLSTEGTVKVMRGTEVVAPEESAAIVRDILERLLSRSVGSMQGLSQAARERDESSEGVGAVISDLETALVPVNRSAARRALARLARETARARDRGKLDRLKTRRERTRSERPARPAREEASGRAEAPPSLPEPRAVPAAPVAAPEVPRAPAAEPAIVHAADTPADSIDVNFSEVPSPVESAAEPIEPTPTVIATTLGEIEGLLVSRAEPPHKDIEEPNSDGRRSKRGAREAKIDLTDKRTVDDLLLSFSVSSLDVDGSMTATRRSLKVLADLDETPPPPTPLPKEEPADRPAELTVALAPKTPPVVGRAPARRPLGFREVAILAACLFIAGLIGHYAPAWFSDTDGPHGDAAASSPPRAL